MASNETSIVGAAGASYGASACALDLFILHATADAAFVRGYLLPALDLPASRVLLLDDLALGTIAVSEIERGVVGSRFTVVVVSGACRDDDWVVFGEQLATHRSVRDVHVVPLRLDNCTLPLRLEARVALDFTDRSCWDSETARLRSLLEIPARAGEVIACPYPGMRPFGTDEAARFFGRDRELADLVARLDHGEREIYVIGPSGSGKSSLVQAGLLARLSAGMSRLQHSFVVRAMRPGEQPVERLTAALDGDPTLPATFAALLTRQPPAEYVLVFIDQLEELFTLADPAARQRFIAVLVALRAEPRLYIVHALRADFYGAFMDCELWPDHGQISRLDIGPLRGISLVQAITRPATQLGVYLEPRLCDRLVLEAAAEPGALPLVQETLRLLWDVRRERLLGLPEYESLADGESALHVAIARHADAVMRRFSGARQAMAHRILLRLVSFGEGRPDTRRQQPVQALRSAEDDETELSSVLSELVAKRLVTVDGNELAHDALVDMSHEALISAWPTLQQWIARRRGDERQRRRLDAKVGEWIDRGRGATSLLDTEELVEAEHWIQSDAARELGYGAELTALIAASRAAIENAASQARRARRVIATAHLERGAALLDSGRPMHALPYFVAARAERLDDTLLRLLFGRASRYLPSVSLSGDVSSVGKIALSPNGMRVVTAGRDATARVWDASTGLPITAPLKHRGAVTAAAFSPDGTRVVTASEDRAVRIWDAATGVLTIPPLVRRGPITAVAFSPDGLRVLAASADTTARVWDVMSGDPAGPPLVHSGSIHAAAFSPDGTRVVTASEDGTARVWDPHSGNVLVPLLVHKAPVRVAAFSPDGCRVVTASNNVAQVWDATTGNPLRRRLEHDDTVTCAAFDHGGTRVVTASLDRTTRIWDAATGKPLTEPLAHPGPVIMATCTAGGRTLITASEDRVQFWDIPTCARTGMFEHLSVLHHAAVAPNGLRIVTAGENQPVQIWDTEIGTAEIMLLAHRTGSISAAVFSPDGARVATAGSDCSVQIWNAITGEPLVPVLEHRGAVTAAVFSPDGAYLVTACRHHAARVWEVATGKPVTAWIKALDAVNSIGFHLDGTRFVTASGDYTARIWSTQTGKQVAAVLRHGAAVTSAAFSPDGTRVVTANDSRASVQVWDAATGERISEPAFHRGEVVTVCFSPTGACVMTTSGDGTARLWSATTGEPVTAPLEHRGRVNAAAFSPDGARIVTASDDTTARIWDAATGNPVTPLLPHRGRVRTAGFSPDGTSVVTASDDGAVRIWDASMGKLVVPALEHGAPVHSSTFSPDGTRVLTASSDPIARIWKLPIDQGSLEDWRLLARCAPFALVDDTLVSNPDPLRVRPPRGHGSTR